MQIGAKVRALFGPYESQVADAYRGLFVDQKYLVDRLSDLRPKRILEVGCGEGAMTTLLAEAFPSSEIVATDISPRLGRLYRGRQAGVTFRQMGIAELQASARADFDLIVVADVLHHIPLPERSKFLLAVRDHLSPSGVFLFKDWEKRPNGIHLLVHALDRWITGDDVSYLGFDEMLQTLARHFPDYGIRVEPSLPPWSQNRVFRVGKQVALLSSTSGFHGKP